MAKVASFETREWIDPWRDRRPMTNDTVLVTFWLINGYEIGFGRWNRGWDICNVVAWKPIEEPYNPVEVE